MNRSRLLLLPLAAILLLPACARPTGRGGYPSLAPRPIEKTSFVEPAPPPAAAATPDPTLDQSIAATRADLDTVTRGFAADSVKAEAAVRAAQGQPAGSDRWLDAQTALGTLDQWHSQLSTLSTDVEERAIARAQILAPPYPGLTNLQAKIEAENAAETATIARLQHGLAPA